MASGSFAISDNVSRLGEVGDFENKIYYGNE